MESSTSKEEDKEDAEEIFTENGVGLKDDGIDEERNNYLESLGITLQND